MVSIYFHANRVQIEDIVSVEVTPSQGRIYPRTSQCFFLRVQSIATATKLTVPLCCTIINITQRREHNKSLVKYREIAAMMEDFFTITEDGEFQPVSY